MVIIMWLEGLGVSGFGIGGRFVGRWFRVEGGVLLVL